MTPFSLRENRLKPAKELREVTGRNQGGIREGCGRAMGVQRASGGRATVLLSSRPQRLDKFRASGYDYKVGFFIDYA